MPIETEKYQAAELADQPESELEGREGEEASESDEPADDSLADQLTDAPPLRLEDFPGHDFENDHKNAPASDPEGGTANKPAETVPGEEEAPNEAVVAAYHQMYEHRDNDIYPTEAGDEFTKLEDPFSKGMTAEEKAKHDEAIQALLEGEAEYTIESPGLESENTDTHEFFIVKTYRKVEGTDNDRLLIVVESAIVMRERTQPPEEEEEETFEAADFDGPDTYEEAVMNNEPSQPEPPAPAPQPADEPVITDPVIIADATPAPVAAVETNPVEEPALTTEVTPTENDPDETSYVIEPAVAPSEPVSLVAQAAALQQTFEPVQMPITEVAPSTTDLFVAIEPVAIEPEPTPVAPAEPTPIAAPAPPKPVATPTPKLATTTPAPKPAEVISKPPEKPVSQAKIEPKPPVIDFSVAEVKKVPVKPEEPTFQTPETPKPIAEIIKPEPAPLVKQPEIAVRKTEAPAQPDAPDHGGGGVKTETPTQKTVSAPKVVTQKAVSQPAVKTEAAAAIRTVEAPQVTSKAEPTTPAKQVAAPLVRRTETPQSVVKTETPATPIPAETQRTNPPNFEATPVQAVHKPQVQATEAPVLEITAAPPVQEILTAIPQAPSVAQTRRHNDDLEITATAPATTNRRTQKGKTVQRHMTAASQTPISNSLQSVRQNTFEPPTRKISQEINRDHQENVPPQDIQAEPINSNFVSAVEEPSMQKAPTPDMHQAAAYPSSSEVTQISKKQPAAIETTTPETVMPAHDTNFDVSSPTTTQTNRYEFPAPLFGSATQGNDDDLDISFEFTPAETGHRTRRHSRTRTTTA